MDPTTDIKETFIAETLIDAFERFEGSLDERVKTQKESKTPIKRMPGGLQTDTAQCSYKLDSNHKPPVIRVMVADEQENRSKYEFTADTVGNGILNMRLVWRQADGGQLFSSEELAEFCFNELLATTPVA